jgi:hypothetical protein
MKKRGNTTKRLTLPNATAFTSPKHKKKQIVTARSRPNRASCTGKNLQKNKKYK